MDPNSALVDDFLTRKASPPAMNNNNNNNNNLGGGQNARGGVHTPPSDVRGSANQHHSHNSNVSSGAPAMDAGTLKRVFQLQQRLAVLLPEVGACIHELQRYNMFPRMGDGSNGGDAATEEAVSILRLLLQPSSDSIGAGGSGGGMYTDFSSGSQGSAYHQSNDNNSSSHHNMSSGAGVPHPWDTSVNTTTTTHSGGFQTQNESMDVFSTFHANKADSGAAAAESATLANTNPNSSSNGGYTFSTGRCDAPAGNATAAAVNAAAAAAAADDFDASNAIAFVEFKRSRFRKYVCEDPEIQPGSYVLVDGDRGVDCGLLVQMIHKLPDGQTSVVCMDGCDIKDEKVKLESGRVIREATEAEVDRLHNTIASAEAVALKTCRQRCQELGIDIDLLDVEYQFDMKKIAFYFDCDHSVDFRSLVRELYRTFGARIWMENVNPKVKNSIPDHSNSNTHNNDREFHHRGGRGGNHRQRRY